MKRKLIQLSQVLNNPYQAPSKYNRHFNGGGTAVEEGFDLSTKEGAEKFLKKNKEMILSMKAIQSAQALEGKVADLEAKNTDLTKRLEKVLSLDAKEFKGLQEEMKQLGLDMKAVKDGSKLNKEFKKGTIAAFLSDNKARIDEFLGKKSGTLSLEYKAVDTNTDIGSGDSFNTVGRDAYFTWHEGGAVGQIPVRRPFMRELFKNVTVGTEWIKFIDQDTIIRNASNVALCGTTTSNTKVTFKVYTVELQKIRDFMDVCLDMMSDYGFIQGEINRLLTQSLDLKIDNDLLLGSGVAPILNGFVAKASTFSATNTDPSLDYTNAVPNATLIDLISICGAQIRQLGQQNMFYPNAVLLNPRDMQGIKFLKNSFGDYIRNSQLITSLFQDAAGRYFIDGMLLIENPLVAANTMYIADFTKGTVYSKPGIGIEFAYENRSNFETETVTVKIYERLNLVIRNVDANAFMKVTDIGAAVASITKAVNP